MNITNHAFFNLAGKRRCARPSAHSVRRELHAGRCDIDPDRRTPQRGADALRLSAAARRWRQFIRDGRDEQLRIGRGYDHNFVISGKPGFSAPPPSLRSRAWFDDPANADMTALYLERYLNFGLSLEELQSGKPIIGIAQTGSDLAPCNRHHLVLAERVREGIREAAASARIPGPSDPGDRQAARPPASTATSPTSAWSRCCSAIRSTAWC